MKFINFAIVKCAVFLSIGILFAHQFPFSPNVSILLLTALVIALIISWWLARKQLIQKIYFGLISYCCFFCIGFTNYQLRQPHSLPNHYVNSTLQDRTRSQSIPVEIEISEVNKPDAYFHKYIAKVKAVSGLQRQGKILLKIKKDRTHTAYTVDDRLLVYGTIESIPESINPNQFDYKAYMQALDVYGQMNIQANDVLLYQSRTVSARGIAERIRSWLLQQLIHSGLEENERVIVQALVLGERRDISKATNAQYAAAGAIHLLAVSGLHVGIVYLVFQFLLSPFHFSKYGRHIKAILLIVLLFAYALLTGFSPSVVRAATMCSLFIFANQLNRETNSINTLFISFFGLLLIQPMWLFQVGFQLSYLAVFFILWIQPLMYRMYRPSNYVIKLFWGIITVSLAAQIGIFPLSLYYFHQFPGLFLLSNLVILPLISFILLGGILFLIATTLEILPSWYLHFYAGTIKTLNRFIGWTAQQDAFLFSDISFSKWQLLSTYFFIIALILLWKKIRFNRLVIALGSLSFFIAGMMVTHHGYTTNRLILFHKTKHSLLVLHDNRKLTVFSADTAAITQQTYPIRNYRIAAGIREFNKNKLPTIFTFKKKTIVVLDSLGVYSSTGKADVVILTHNPKVHLTRLIDELDPSLIVSDGSNYENLVHQWKRTCQLKKLPFHHTGNKGAFILE